MSSGGLVPRLECEGIKEQFHFVFIPTFVVYCQQDVEAALHEVEFFVCFGATFRDHLEQPRGVPVDGGLFVRKQATLVPLRQTLTLGVEHGFGARCG